MHSGLGIVVLIVVELSGGFPFFACWLGVNDRELVVPISLLLVRRLRVLAEGFLEVSGLCC